MADAEGAVAEPHDREPRRRRSLGALQLRHRQELLQGPARGLPPQHGRARAQEAHGARRGTRDGRRRGEHDGVAGPQLAARQGARGLRDRDPQARAARGRREGRRQGAAPLADRRAAVARATPPRRVRARGGPARHDHGGRPRPRPERGGVPGVAPQAAVVALQDQVRVRRRRHGQDQHRGRQREGRAELPEVPVGHVPGGDMPLPRIDVRQGAVRRPPEVLARAARPRPGLGAVGPRRRGGARPRLGLAVRRRREVHREARREVAGGLQVVRRGLGLPRPRRARPLRRGATARARPVVRGQVPALHR